MDDISSHAKIKAQLFTKGYALRDVDKEFGLPAHTASKTLQIPHLKGEVAIAAILGVKNLFELWPDRYSPSGQRLSPFKYERPLTREQRRNGVGKLAATLLIGCLFVPALLTGDSARAADFMPDAVASAVQPALWVAGIIIIIMAAAISGRKDGFPMALTAAVMAVASAIIGLALFLIILMLGA